MSQNRKITLVNALRALEHHEKEADYYEREAIRARRTGAGAEIYEERAASHHRAFAAQEALVDRIIADIVRDVVSELPPAFVGRTDNLELTA